MAKQATERVTQVDLPREIRRDIHEHEIFLSFVNDEDAALFAEWWHGGGAVLFQKYVNKQRGGAA